MISKALETLTPTLRDVAGWLDASYEAVRSYRMMRRGPPPDVVRKLAKVLRRQAAKLESLARRLENEAE